MEERFQPTAQPIAAVLTDVDSTLVTKDKLGLKIVVEEGELDRIGQSNESEKATR